MPRYTIPFLILFININIIALGQETTLKEKEQLIDQIDSLIDNYIQFGSFRDGYSDASVAPFRQLFQPDAIIFDELNANFLNGNYNDPYKLSSRSMNDFLQKTAATYPTGLTVKLINLNVDYTGIAKKEVNIAIEKNVSGITKNGFLIQNSDTLLIQLSIAGNNKVLIKKISSLGYHFIVMNDKDGDFISDETDKCPDESGVVTNRGCPPAEGQSLFAAIMIRGGGVSSSYQGPGMSNLGYDHLITNVSQIGEMNQGGSFSSDIGASAMMEFFFGRKKSFGISVGAAWDMISTKAGLANFEVQFQSTDQFDTTYKRIISADLSDNNRIEEDLTFQFLSIPLMLNYKMKLSQKLYLNIGFGGGYSILLRGTSQSNSTFDYEAVYGYEDGHFTFKESESGADWQLTRDHEMSITNNNEAKTQEYFTTHHDAGYDVGLNQGTNSKSDFNLNGGICVIFKPALLVSLSDHLYLNLAPEVKYTSISRSNDDKFVLTNKIGSYNSLMNGTKEYAYLFYGLNVGLNFGFK